MSKIIKMRKQLVIMCLIIVTTSQIIVYAHDGENNDKERMASISSYNASFTISNNGIASIDATVIGKSGVKNTYVKAVLQRETTSGWKEVETWEKESQTLLARIEETYQVSSGTYRIVATFTADSETKSMTTASKTY
jgi:hypothetical protein